MSSLLFFIAAYLLGKSILKLGKIEIPAIEKAASIVIGLVMLNLVLYFAAGVFGLTQELIITICLIGLIGAIGLERYFFPERSQRLILIRIFDSVPLHSGKKLFQFIKNNFSQIFIWGFLFLLIVWLFGRALFIDPQGNLVAGDRLVWTDWPLHIGMAASFAWGDNFPAQNPTFAGEPLRYPFFADFLTGVLWKLGLPLPTALALPAIVLVLAFFGIFVQLCREILAEVGSFASEIKFEGFKFLPLILSLFWGGLGFVYYFQDLLKSGGFITGNFFPIREYTFWQEKNLWFFTFLYSEILPQRAFIFGLPLFFLVLYLVKSGVVRLNEDGKRQIVLAGILAGVMPFFHTHSYLSLVFLAGAIGVIGAVRIVRGSKTDRKRFFQALFLFFLPLGVLSILQLPLFLDQFRGWPFEFGWMKGTDNFFWFWFKNTGFFIPLTLLGQGKLGKSGKLIVGASWILFILPNLFHFAPWGYDNLKILTYWYLLSSIGATVALYQIKQIRLIGPVSAILIFLTLILSGIIEIARIVDTPKNQIGLWSKADQELAVEVKNKTEPRAVILAAAIHDHPVEALAGRRMVIGYPGNSWSWGLKDWDVRFQDVKTMFGGGEVAKNLWKKYGVDYIIISDRERYMDSQIAEEFIRQNGEEVIVKGNTKVYKIN